MERNPAFRPRLEFRALGRVVWSFRMSSGRAELRFWQRWGWPIAFCAVGAGFLVLRWRYYEDVVLWLGLGIAWGVDNAMEKHLVRLVLRRTVTAAQIVGYRADDCPLDEPCHLNQTWPQRAIPVQKRRYSEMGVRVF